MAFALDYHRGGRPLQDRAEINARLTMLSDNPERARAITRAGLDVLLTQPRTNPSRVAAIGYCHGGTLVLELARSGADLKAVIGFHPGLTTERPQDSANIGGKVLVCVGADDPLIGPPPNYTGCPPNVWSNTGNLAAPTNLLDDSQLPGGHFYDPYSSAQTTYGTYKVTDIFLVVDGFQPQAQTAQFDNSVINQTTYTYEKRHRCHHERNQRGCRPDGGAAAG